MISAGKQLKKEMLSDLFKQNIKSQFWRLNHLYFVKNKDGKCVTFVMTPEQEELYKNKHNRNIVLKARQLGMTTFACILELDEALWRGRSCAMIADTARNAQRLFDEKIRWAYDRLPQEIRNANPTRKDNAASLVFKKGGSVYVDVSFRGGTVALLHISEFAKICAKNREKAREIMTGAIEAVPLNGTVIIESTAEGATGSFAEICDVAMKQYDAGTELTTMDYKLFFFSWYTNPEYWYPEEIELPEYIIQYFKKMRLQVGFNFHPRQMAWYWKKEATLGDDMKREYPTTPQEAFEVPVKGAYYANQIGWLYKNDRITKDDLGNEHLPVCTVWDIGVGDATTIWFYRLISKEQIQIIDYYENNNEGMRHYFKVLKHMAERYGWTYSDHYAPHDIQNREFGSDAKSRKDLARQGYEIDGELYKINFKVVKSVSIDTGIESVREILPYCVFNAVKCAKGIEHLQKYRKSYNEKLNVYNDAPLHDEHSHGADAFRMLAVSLVNQIRFAKKLNLHRN